MGKKKSAKGPKVTTPGHYTESGTRKYQTNGPIAWSREFVLAAHGGREGEGINAALAYAVAHRADFQSWATRARKADAVVAKVTKAANAPAVKAVVASATKRRVRDDSDTDKRTGEAARARGRARAAKANAALKAAPEQVSLPEVK